MSVLLPCPGRCDLLLRHQHIFCRQPPVQLEVGSSTKKHEKTKRQNTKIAYISLILLCKFIIVPMGNCAPQVDNVLNEFFGSEHEQAHETTSQQQRQHVPPNNISSLLSQLHTMNYFLLYELYTKHYCIYLHLKNHDYFMNTANEYSDPKLKKRWQPRVEIVAYKLFYREVSIDLPIIQRQFASSKCLNLATLPKSVRANMWRCLTFKQAFHNLFPKLCFECSVHASVLRKSEEVTKDMATTQIGGSRGNISNSIGDGQQQESTIALTDDNNLCLICLDHPGDLTLCCCMSNLCESCLKSWNKLNRSCPVCRKAIDANHPAFQDQDELFFENVNEYPLSREQVTHIIVEFIDCLEW